MFVLLFVSFFFFLSFQINLSEFNLTERMLFVVKLLSTSQNRIRENASQHYALAQPVSFQTPLHFFLANCAR